MCQRGFSECYNEYDVFDAIVYSMCSKCPNQPSCGISVEDDEEGEESCRHIGQMVQCIYDHFNKEEDKDEIEEAIDSITDSIVEQMQEDK